MGRVSKRAMSEPDRDAIVHTLANMVQALNGNLELLSTQTTDETALRYLANARAAAQNLEELTRRLRHDKEPEA